MVDIATLRKATAAIAWLHEKGIGYILTDSNGRSLQNLSTTPPAQDVEALLLDYIERHGKFDYRIYKKLLGGQDMAIPELISFIVKNNLAFRPRPFIISRMPDELSFKVLLG